MSVYNGMPYLMEAVRSILNQSFKGFEFIVVDDASTDNSLRFLHSLKDKRLKILRNKKNLGLAASLNKALKVARGEYIARMDADDLSYPKRLEKQIKFMIKNPSIDLCGTWVDLINENGGKIGEKRYPSNPKRLKNSISWYTAVVHPTYFGKKSLFDELKGYRENFDFAEDYDFLSRARSDFKIANIPQILFQWRLWDKRRSRSEMNMMDKIDLNIKLDMIKREGLTLTSGLAVFKKILVMYLVPSFLKSKLATFFKQA